ncbi:Crp/Fnr family transcriptional regulator [Kitasatospora cineracea]|uniref:Crp/Fnr family transcriptional regulator n=1 Tax=Kitasatospora cineracea TaxID=88074 RepID=UPI00380F7460
MAKLAEVVRSVGRPVAWRRGEALLREREAPDRVVLIVLGRVKVTAEAVNGRTGLLAVRGPGELIGEQSCVDGNPRSATATALEKGSGVEVGIAEFRQLLRDDPVLADVVLRAMSERLREADRGRVRLGALSVRARTADFLVTHMEQGPVTHAEQGGVSAVTSGVQWRVSLTQQDMAAAVGASREQLVRVLREFSDRGWLSRNRQRPLVVLDPKSLAAAVTEPPRQGRP